MFYSWRYWPSVPFASPLPNSCFTIVGVRKPEGGYGKALKPKLTPKEKPLRIRRVRKPTTVRQPPAQFESGDEEEEKPKEPTIASLSATIITLRLEIRSLNNRLSESILKTRNLEDDINNIRHGVGKKINRLAKAVGKEDAVDPYF